MKHSLLKPTFLFLFLLIYAKLSAQTVSITSNPGTSGNIVIGGSNYHVLEAIYLESEIGAGTFISAPTAINRIEFNVNTLGTTPSVSSPNFQIYLKNVAAGTTTLATGSYSTAGYTLVYSGAYSYPAVGWQGVNLTTTFTQIGRAHV